jgi:hypothetical protein
VTRHKDDTSCREDAPTNDPRDPALRIAAVIPRVFVLPSLLAACAFAAAAALPNDPTLEAAPLSFTDFFKNPVGPRGLEPGARLLALAGKRVETAGYLVQRSDPSGPLIVAPVPVVIGDEDESFADDLPAGVAYLHPLDARTAEALQACRGVLRVRGRLDIGRMTEEDGRQSFIRLQADAAQCAGTPER